MSVNVASFVGAGTEGERILGAVDETIAILSDPALQEMVHKEPAGGKKTFQVLKIYFFEARRPEASAGNAGSGAALGVSALPERALIKPTSEVAQTE